ncbi:MAG: winged helix-turn-helix domain-containing protein [Alphaproteobacteria bacterium]|nr:winged helix-turn-helix domain-containing protein [Alphaproteobacteria bacterium]
MLGSSTDRKNTQITICANKIVQDNLKLMLDQAKLVGFFVFETHNEDVVILRHEKQEIAYSLPLRIGVLFDQINLLNKKAKMQSSATMDLGYGVLNVNLGSFTPFRKTKKAKDKIILLTEKEVEILRYLHDNATRKIPREELLEFVWGYAKNTETHTLETHIHRLRRKIEPDTASPVVLKKDEEGYFLGGRLK